MAPQKETSNSDSDDGFEIIGDLPTRLKESADESGFFPDASIQIHRIPDTEDVLISIKPPKQPQHAIEHVSCDIVLAIDVSASMNASADLLQYGSGEKQESSGLSVLDLVKHAARTIIESLNADDRLAVIAFSNGATIVQGLLSMTKEEKKATLERVEALEVKECTNLWSGIRESLRIFEKAERIGNVQRMFVLTDGVPNHMCPSQGYVKKLQPMLKEVVETSGSAPTISTFGFGYYLRSALLRSIAEVGSGNYAFIPDAGMIGTVFVHAIANLFSTFATDATMTVECARADSKVVAPGYLDFANQALASNSICLSLGNIQYGQTRDIVLKVRRLAKNQNIKATLRYRNAGEAYTTSTNSTSTERCSLSQAVIDYHYSRHDICSFLADLSTKNVNGEHANLSAVLVQNKASKLVVLISEVQRRCGLAQKNSVSSIELEDLVSLLHDLRPAEGDNADLHGTGQISLALQAMPPGAAQNGLMAASSPHPRGTASTVTYYDRWGQHYLSSILHAHMFQLCLTFKDPGPLRYGVNSPLFIKCRDKLDSLFDDLPAPKPSRTRVSSNRLYWASSSSTTAASTPVRMSRWNSVSNPCFGAKNLVYMATDEDNFIGRTVEQVRVGDLVQTRAGSRSVTAIVKTDVSEQIMYTVHNDEDQQVLSVTPWHPVLYEQRWQFPANVLDIFDGALSSSIVVNESIYSFMLEKDDDCDAHSMRVGGCWSVTLGHGILDSDTRRDARAHGFFGAYDRIAESLEVLDKDEYGRRLSGGVAKVNDDCSVGLAYKFLRTSEVDRYCRKEKEKWNAAL